MTETMGTPPGSSPAAEDTTTRDIAKDEARGVAADAVDSGKQTVSTAKEQAGQVASEAATQAQKLLQQAKDELGSQGSDQKQRAATGLRSLADELDSMANQPSSDPSSQPGMATDLAREASQRARSAADWIESRQPGDIVDEVRRFARQRPGVFLLSAAAVGFLGGRLTRGLTAQGSDQEDSSSPSGTVTGEPLAGIGTPAGTATPVVDPQAPVATSADVHESPTLGTPGGALG